MKQVEGFGKVSLAKAIDEFLRSCRLRNLSPKTIRYNGNRFEAVERKYPPMFLENEFGLDVPVRMTQVPRLAKEGDSFMDVTTGDMTAPCVCMLNQRAKQAFMVFFNQGDHHLNHGVTLEQTGDRLCIRLRAPAKRRLVYRWYDGVPSLRENPAADAPLKVEAGTETTIPHRVFTFPCEDIPALYRAFFEKRFMLFGAKPHANLPFSAFWDYAEAQMNAGHFVEDQGLYTLNARDGRDQSHFGFWQVGWVAAYDYEFPAASRFGKMGVRTAGSVWANVQNKHSAPGLCTVSPAALLKLYRATGDGKYLELMRQIAHFMPQVASYPERPVQTVSGSMLKPGEMCERVNMSDWEGNENVGDSIFGSSSWPEVSLMLTWLDVPGVYVVPSRGVVCASDHVNAWLDGGMLHIQNPTGLPARVKVFIDDEKSIRSNLGLWWQDAFQRIEIAAGECAELRLPAPNDLI